MFRSRTGNGNLCPHASERIDIESNGKILAVDAGDPGSAKPFPLPYVNAFHGKCAAWIRNPGKTLILAESGIERENRSDGNHGGSMT